MKTPQQIETWLRELRKSYIGIDTEREYHKMEEWCKVHHKQPTERRFIAWLNRVDVLPTSKPTKVYGRNYLPPMKELEDAIREEYMQKARKEIAKLREQFKMP